MAVVADAVPGRRCELWGPERDGGAVGRGFVPSSIPHCSPHGHNNSAAWDKAGFARAELTCWVISTELGLVVFCPWPWWLSITGRGRGGCMVQIKTGMEEILNHYFITPLLKKKPNKQTSNKPTRNTNPVSPQRFSLLHCLISLAPVFPDQLTDLISRELDARFRVLFWELRTHTLLKVTSGPSTLPAQPCSAGRWKGLYWKVLMHLACLWTWLPQRERINSGGERKRK